MVRAARAAGRERSELGGDGQRRPVGAAWIDGVDGGVPRVPARRPPTAGRAVGGDTGGAEWHGSGDGSKVWRRFAATSRLRALWCSGTNTPVHYILFF